MPALEITFLLYLTISLLWQSGITSYFYFFFLISFVNIILLCWVDFNILAIIIASYILLYLFYIVCKNKSKKTQNLSTWVLFLPALILNLLKSTELIFSEEFSILLDTKSLSTFGLNFHFIRVFLTLRASFRDKFFDAYASFLNLTFFPSFGMGPLTSHDVWKEQNIQKKLNNKEFLDALMLLGWGASCYYILGNRLLNRLYAEVFFMPTFPSTYLYLIKIYFSQIALYLNFSGYCLMALAYAKILGVTLPYNFNKPYLSTSVSDYWSRWHITFRDFIFTYIIGPIIRNTRKKNTAIFTGIFITALWHDVSLKYILWGVAHSFLLIITPQQLQLKNFLELKIGKTLTSIIFCVSTLTMISSLSHYVRN